MDDEVKFTVKDYMLCYIALRLGAKSNSKPILNAGEWTWDGTFDVLVLIGKKHWPVSVHPDMCHD